MRCGGLQERTGGFSASEAWTFRQRARSWGRGTLLTPKTILKSHWRFLSRHGSDTVGGPTLGESGGWIWGELALEVERCVSARRTRWLERSHCSSRKWQRFSAGWEGQRTRTWSSLWAGTHFSDDGPCPEAGEFHALHQRESALARTPLYSLLILGRIVRKRGRGSEFLVLVLPLSNPLCRKRKG